MEQTPPPPSSSSTPHPTDQQPPPPPTATTTPSPSLLPPSSSSSLPPTSSSATPSSSNPNPSVNPATPQHQQPQNSQNRPPFNRNWQQPPSHFPHFSSSSSSSAVPPFSSPSPPSVSAPLSQRGGMAIGVPAHHPSPPPPFGQQFGGLGRSSVSVPEPVATSSLSQVRQSIQGIQGVGTVGSFALGSQMRPGGITAQHQQRPVQPSFRPPSAPNNPSPASQNFQGQSLLRVSSGGSPGSPSPSTSLNQPWLSSGSQGKPPLPSPAFRPQMGAQSLQQRPHISQQHHHQMSTASQQQQAPSSQPQRPSPSTLPQDHLGQQFPPPRSITQQLQMERSQGSGNQKAPSHGIVQPSSPAVQSGPPTRESGPPTRELGPPTRVASPETCEPCNRILSKRSIQELVTQIDPSETLDPEVEDILVDIADDFVESITTFGCSLAKHRKSSTLEAKDILLHLERNWNMTLPGFGGDEIKTYKKPFSSDIHRERLALIKRSMVSAETANTKSSAGQGGGNAKGGGHLAKASVNVLASPTPKLREAA